MFETNENRYFMKWLVQNKTVNFENLLERNVLQQKIDYFKIPKLKGISQPTYRIPIIKSLQEKARNDLFRTRGENKTTGGYLEPYSPSKQISSSIFKLLDKKKINLERGFKTYKFYAEPTKYEINVIIIAPYEYNVMIDSQLPYTVNVKYLGRARDNEMFLLTDRPDPSALKLPEIDLPFVKLDLNDTRKIISDVSSLSMGKGDLHILDCLIAPHIGSQIFGNSVNDVGSSYIKRKGVSQDVFLLNDALNNQCSGIPLGHFGIINYLNGLPAKIENMRIDPQVIKKLNVLSWDVQTSEKENNLTLSEFRYKTDAINVDNKRELVTNTALQYSMVYYALLKNKSILRSTYYQICQKVIKLIHSYKLTLRKTSNFMNNFKFLQFFKSRFCSFQINLCLQSKMIQICFHS